MQSLHKWDNISQLSRKRKKKHNKTILLEKDTLNTIEVLISKALFNSYICHGQFVSFNNVLRENNEMQEEIKNCETFSEYTI